jgi:hypothetical protein
MTWFGVEVAWTCLIVGCVLFLLVMHVIRERISGPPSDDLG